MRLPGKSILTLAQAAARWNFTIQDLACYAFDQTLTLSVVVTAGTADASEVVTLSDGRSSRLSLGRCQLTGAYDLSGIEVWPAFCDGSATIRQLRSPAEPNRHLDIVQPVEGLVVSPANLVIRREEGLRFAAALGLPAPDCNLGEVGRRAGGKSAQYDWDGFWIKVCRRLHDDGRPETQAVLVHDMLDWFSSSGGEFPDASTVKKKLTRLWREFETT